MTLLTVPARPTKPSSKPTQLRAAKGTVKSQTSETSWRRLAKRSLGMSHVSLFLFLGGDFEVYKNRMMNDETHFRICLLSTTPSPSLRSILASRSFSLNSVYSCAETLKTSPMAQKR